MNILDKYTTYGYTYELFASELIGTNNVGLKRYRAIYAHVGKPEIYEILIIRERTPDVFLKKSDNWLKYPSTSEWGDFGWTKYSLKSAYDKYRQIPSILSKRYDGKLLIQ